MLVTALGDFQVFIEASGCHDPFIRVFRDPVQGLQNRRPYPVSDLKNRVLDLVVAVRSDDRVNLGDLVQNLLTVALRHASGDNQRGAATLGLIPGHIQDRLNAFFLCGIDKAAGIDNDNVRLGLVVRHLVAMTGKLAEHALGIHKILVAAKRDK